MICLEVYFNGEKLCQAGMESLTVLSGILNFVNLEDTEEEMMLEVGGLYPHDAGVSAHPRWVQHLKVKTGDEITMRFIESDSADEPVDHGISTREWVEEQERSYYERMKAKFETPESPHE
jgi:hypothetical protein